ncbi:uncharacterized transposon-derived protein F54H12.3 [Trichonephila clavipes]|nr:uncharacterized transposon-derived protein F54H12.3 [Trichonephila clavipes]
MDFEKVYQETEHPGSFGGVEALFKATNGKFSRKDIKKWLCAKDSYTLHKPIKKKFKKNRVLISRMNQQYHADLVDMQYLSKFNGGVVSAFEQIFSERVPLKLQTDAGEEFTNKLFQNYLKKKKIGFFITSNNTKASIVERFNRMLKTKMWKLFTEKKTKRYIHVVDKLVYSYNNTWHRSIQMTPASVTETNQSQVWENLYGKQNNKKVNKPNYRLNDTVRIRNKTSHFTTQLPTPITLNDEWEMGLVDFVYPHTWYNIREDNNLFAFDLGDEKSIARRIPQGFYESIPDILDGITSNIAGDVQAPLLKIVKVEGKDGEVVNAHYTRPHYVPVIRRHFQTVEMVLRLHSEELVPLERGRVIAVLHFRMRQIV